jgi:hypothetical protein
VASITVTLYEPSSIAELEFLGEGTAHVSPGSTAKYVTAGSFEVEGPNAGTYGVG